MINTACLFMAVVTAFVSLVIAHTIGMEEGIYVMTLALFNLGLANVGKE